MRTAVIYGIRNGGPEEIIKTVSSAEKGRAAVAEAKATGLYSEIVIRDCLGGLRGRERVTN